MAKNKQQYVCTECGGMSTKWQGQCPDCQQWNTMTEQIVSGSKGGQNRYSSYAGSEAHASVTRLADVGLSEDSRESTTDPELDRVLGGGLVNGSVVLLGGDPGIGKSTLLLQVMASLSERLDCLYVTGEESLQQIAMRASRLELDASRIDCLAETSVEQILAQLANQKPSVVVIDSIQTLYSEQLQSAPGSVAQVRESTAALLRHAKSTNTTVILVGHVTKEGGIAGPRVLEHMVDAVLYFEGSAGSRYRVIRALKNRFGAANELGVFAMTGTGLRAVSNPSAIFLSGQGDEAAGSAIVVTREGTRPMLIELQALVASSHLGNPRRVVVGMEQNRLAMLLAVLQRHCGLELHDQDVFINIVGGLRISETAVDLPLAMAIWSSLSERILNRSLIAFGEVGLSGEVRPVHNGEERLREAAKHGFETAIIPHANAQSLPDIDMKIIAVRRLSEAIEQL